MPTTIIAPNGSRITVPDPTPVEVASSMSETCLTEMHVWRCICSEGGSQIRMNRGCDLCTIEELPE